MRLLLKNNKMVEALDLARSTNKRFPDDAEGIAVLGFCLQVTDDIAESLIYLNKAITLNPTYAEAFINRDLIRLVQEDKANALKDLETAYELKPHIKQIWSLVIRLKMEFKEFSATIALLEEITKIDPDNEKFLASMALCHKNLKDFDSAIVFYKKALAIKPDNAQIYNNMGITLQEQGKLEETIEVYNNALSIKPDDPEITQNSLTLQTQTQVQVTVLTASTFSNQATESSTPDTKQRPKSHIINAISSFLAADRSKAQIHIQDFNMCDPKLIANLAPKDKLFCFAYSGYLCAPLKEPFEKSPDIHNDNVIYHLGKSHCLSYAHRNTGRNGATFRVAPMTTFGAKAFHFSKTKGDAYKSITNSNLTAIPQGSKVFISFGEIDRRPNEGFISAVTKLNKSNEGVSTNSVIGYLKWFSEQNKTLNHSVYMLNVPAPMYDIRYKAKINAVVANVVALFNT